MVRLGLVGITLLSACSFAYDRPPITAATARPSCTNPRPQIDSAIGAGLIIAGLATGASMVEGSDSLAMPVAIGTAFVAAGAVFITSAIHGSRDDSACEQELVALRPSEPLHAETPTAAPTCEQRRLDMYSRAVTGADPVQRVQLLTALPSCEESTTRERAWALTRMAALDAGEGHCDEVSNIAHEVYRLDVVLHDVVLMGDVEIKHCLLRVEL